MALALHLGLDAAWDSLARELDLPSVPLPEGTGRRLRFCAPEREIEAFWAEVAPRLAPFGGTPLLYGSGDFHHLAGLWIRRTLGGEPLTLLSFDNHPDWAVTPPRWACGGWINRALELPGIAEAAVWGCANMELNWPIRLLGNRRAVHEERLRIFPWRERFPKLAEKAWPWLDRETWRGRFEAFLAGRKGRRFYVTVDLDCLRAGEALTDWENGLFTVEDVAWALERVREAGTVAGGDLCGAASGQCPEAYARPVQRFLAKLDHPELPPRTAVDLETGRIANERAARWLLPLLAGE